MKHVDINVNRVVIIFSVNLYKLLIPKDIYFGIIFLPILGTKALRPYRHLYGRRAFTLSVNERGRCLVQHLIA